MLYSNKVKATIQTFTTHRATIKDRCGAEGDRGQGFNSVQENHLEEKAQKGQKISFAVIAAIAGSSFSPQ